MSSPTSLLGVSVLTRCPAVCQSPRGDIDSCKVWRRRALGLPVQCASVCGREPQQLLADSGARQLVLRLSHNSVTLYVSAENS